ncbi:class I SAM-dependent methyltransferase [Limoniibacter endophyticus]|uniref:O-methyltransferase n=1 Tax=Limoniibacter endophyticus TaxID=1565040 RepID=A0A8J3DQW9_9HYPH|nr:class I SAM-dependent methyltransferase [Limoniibacter endophyticus]GHC75116.1 O-methyltransferase [Limoniibacter endophyticus]
MAARSGNANGDHGALMDGNYRYQRHIYDLTRKYYLLGRDRLIDEIEARPGQTILELGCGTGRNLRLTAKLYPQTRLFGLDISAQMLATARAKFRGEDLSHKITLVKGDAARFSAADFGQGGFDHVFISYALSMIPDWEGTLDAASEALNPGGALHIVDFGSAARLPRFFQNGLRSWLARYHVSPRDSLREVAESFCEQKGLNLRFDSAFRDYAQFLKLTRPS